MRGGNAIPTHSSNMVDTNTCEEVKFKKYAV